MNSSNIKKKLHALCVTFVQQRIADAKQAMDDAQESANQEEKSSAGDKYETGRAMAQQTRDQAAEQLDGALKLKSVLDQIDSNIILPKVGLGSLVITDQNRFYISISAGKLLINEAEYFAVSPQSPVGKLLLNCKSSDTISFQNRTQVIVEIL